MPDPDPASSHTGAAADTAETTMAGPSPRWWRNRRRWFYLIVTTASVALLWGGWSWWYRADFPMPPMGWLEKVGIDPGPVVNRLDIVHFKLKGWKIECETRRLRLEGTIWKLAYSPGIEMLEFGLDGRIRLRPVNALEVFFDDDPFLPQLLPNQAVSLSRFDGAAYRFEGTNYRAPERHDLGAPWPETPNLVVSGSVWEIRGVYDGVVLSLCFNVRNPSESFPQGPWIANLRKAEAGARHPQ